MVLSVLPKAPASAASITTTTLPLVSRPYISHPLKAVMAASTSSSLCGRACTRMLAISPSGATTRSAPRRPCRKARRSTDLRGVVIAIVLQQFRSARGRAGRAGRHLIDPYCEPIAADRRNGQHRHQHRGQEKERKDFHAPAVQPSLRVVVSSDGHVIASFFRISGFGRLQGRCLM